jgi:hypothetical protein
MFSAHITLPPASIDTILKIKTLTLMNLLVRPSFARSIIILDRKDNAKSFSINQRINFTKITYLAKISQLKPNRK